MEEARTQTPIVPVPPEDDGEAAWIFDLDNTLYPPSMRLFDQIEARMTRFVMEALGVDRERADHLRRHYWQRHGTTLAGLMREHGIDPHDYLHAVHDIDFSPLAPDPILAARIAALPGRRIVHTNGPKGYAERVLEARGLAELFDAVFGIEETGFAPKPEARAHDLVIAAAGISPRQATMFEDDPRNLAVPHARGMRTVLVRQDRESGTGDAPRAHPHVHHVTDDLAAFLGQLLEE